MKILGLLLICSCSAFDSHCDPADRFDPYQGICTTTTSCDDQDRWARCDSPCANLDELACITTAGCHAVLFAVTPDTFGFTHCVALPPGHVEGGHCLGLTAPDCLTHDDCISKYDREPVGTEGAYRTWLRLCDVESAALL
jgi:hypothetical protein